jgi:hypothetical protein
MKKPSAAMKSKTIAYAAKPAAARHPTFDPQRRFSFRQLTGR